MNYEKFRSFLGKKLDGQICYDKCKNEILT